MPAATIVKIQTNIPIVMSLQYVDFSKSKTEGWGDQIALKGTIAGEKGTVYVSSFLASTLIANGVIETNGQDRDGNQAYKVLYKGALTILRTEEGGKKITTFSRADQGALPQTSQAVAAGPTPLAARSGSQVTGQSGTGVTPTPAPAAPHSVTPSLNDWTVLERQYERARVAACNIWGNDYHPQALVAATATFFIEANKRGLIGPARLEALAEMPAALKQEEPW